MFNFHSRASVLTGRLLWVILSFFISGNSFVTAQAWMKYVVPENPSELSQKSEQDSVTETYSKSQEYTFYDIQKAFRKYWKNKKVEKGKGYKQYRRWEDFMRPRVYPAGQLDLNTYYKALTTMALEDITDSTYMPEWKYMGPFQTPVMEGSANKSGNGRLNCVAFHPTDSLTMLVGAPSGGIWKTTDGGLTWNTGTDKLPSIGISDIVYDYVNPDTVYAVTGDGDNYHTFSIGLIKSMDGGDTWTVTGFMDELSEMEVLSRIIMHPAQPNVMLLSSSEGIYRTDDGWETHTKVMNGHFQDLEYKHGDPNTIYATSYDYFGNAKVYRSTNGGNSFSIIMDGFNTETNVSRIELAVTPDNPERIYALASRADDDGFFGLFASNNGGDLWSLRYSSSSRNLLGWNIRGTDKGGQGWYDLSLAVSPVNEDDIYLGGINVWESHNGGVGWVITTYWQHGFPPPYVHADHHMLKYNPHNNYIYSCNDGGLYYSENGDNWTDLSSNLEILQVYRISNAYQDSVSLIIGNQDNGTLLKKDSVFMEVLGGDGMNCIIDYSDTSTVYASVYEGTLFRSDDGGKTFNFIVPDNYPRGAWITPFEQHPHIPVILYAGYQDVYKSSNKGESWTRLTNNLVTGENEYLTVVKIAPSNNGFIYAATERNIWRSTDNGDTWDKIGSTLPALTITDIEISENDPNKLWICYSGFNSLSKVYYSHDGGYYWNNISDGLPNVPVNCLEYLNGSDKGIFAGTDMGVFFKDATTSDWKSYRGNLPNVVVNELEIHYPTRKLRAGTFGRGIWETTISDTISPLRFDFEANILKPCSGAEVEFRLIAGESYDSITWYFGENITILENINDTLVKVTFNSLDTNSVELNVYKDAEVFNEIKSNYIEVVPSIDFRIYPDVIVSCVLDTTMLYIDSEFDYIWEPDTHLLHLDKTKTLAYPSEPLSYTVTGSHGLCRVQRKVTFSETPDSVCNALFLPLGEFGPISNECATVELNEPIPPAGSGGNLGCYAEDGWCSVNTTIENTVWFKTVMPESGEMSIQTSGFDNQLAVYSAGSCESILSGEYELIAANDDYTESAFNAAAIKSIAGPLPGDTVWIQIDGGLDGEVGLFSLEISPFFIVGNKDIYSSRIENLKIYPNPTSGELFIQLPEFPYDKGNIEIINMQGKLIYHEETYGMNNNLIHLSIRFEPGLYFIRLKIKDQIFVGKILMK